MTKLVTRKVSATTTTPPSEWAAYRADGGHRFNRDIAVDPYAVVTMMDELALRVQAGIHPQTTWRLEDNWVLRQIAFRWAYPSGQYELIVCGDDSGLHIWLYPTWERFSRRVKVEPLAYWPCHRSKGELSYETRGDLLVYRGDFGPGGGYRTTSLRFEHRLLEGVPRAKAYPHYDWRPDPVLPELGGDIIAVTSRHLALAAAA
jgi:hypothetical protein